MAIWLLRPAPAGLFLPVGAPQQNTVIQLKARALDKRLHPEFDCHGMFLGGVKVVASGLRIAAVILDAFAGQITVFVVVCVAALLWFP